MATLPTGGVKYNSRTAEANAAAQDNSRNAALSKPASVQTFIDPSTGKDSRTPVYGTTNALDSSGNPIDIRDSQGNITGQQQVIDKNNVSYQDGTGKLTTQPITGPINYQQNNQSTGNLNEAKNVYANNGAGLGTSYNPSTGTTQVVGNGNIQQAEIDRLRASGMTEDQIRTQVNSQQPKIQDAFNQIGTNSAQSAADAAEKQLTTQHPEATPEQIYQVRASAAQEEAANAQKSAADAAKAGATPPTTSTTTAPTTSSNIPAAPTAAPDAATPATTPAAAGASAAFANLPPEAQFLAPYLQQFQDTINQSLQDNASNTKSTLAGIDSTYGGIQTKLDDFAASQKATSAAMQSIIDDAKEQQDQNLALQEQSAKEQASWADLESRRKLSKQKADQHDAMVANFALNDAGGQVGAASAVMESDVEFENQMSDLAVQFGYQSNDLAAKFSGLYMQNQDNHTQATIANMKDLQTQLETIGMQGITNDVARQQAEQGVLDKAFETQTGLRTDLAKQNLAVAGQISGMITQKRSDDYTKQQGALAQLQWAVGTYGNNVPQSILDMVKKDLPAGTNLQSILNSPTIEQQKMKKTGGSGSGGTMGISFGSSQLKPDGSAPSFEDFVRQKEADAVASGAKSFDSSVTAMKQYQQEYNTKVATLKKYDPSSINVFMKDRIKNIKEKNVRENIQSTVDDYLKNGQNELAYNYVDGLGNAPSSTERSSYSKAASAKESVNKIAGLIENLGEIGPVIGRIREQNPYDDKIIELNQLTTQAIPTLARGIFGEVGVLTNQDIDTYRSTMANPELTLNQARTATKNLLITINNNVAHQLEISRASGIATRDLSTVFSTIPDYEFGSVNTQSADDDFAKSILLSK